MEFSSDYENNIETKLNHSTMSNEKNSKLSSNSSLDEKTPDNKTENFNDKSNDLSNIFLGKSRDSIESYCKSTLHDSLRLSAEDQRYVGSDPNIYEFSSHDQISPQISVDNSIQTENSKLIQPNQNSLNIDIQETISFIEFMKRMLDDPEINHTPEGLEEMDRRMYDLLKGKTVPISPKK